LVHRVKHPERFLQHRMLSSRRWFY